MKNMILGASFLCLAYGTFFASDREIDRKVKAHDTQDPTTLAQKILWESSLYHPIPNNGGGILAMQHRLYIKLHGQPSRELASIATPDSICFLEISPDGEMVAAGTKCGRHYLWNTQSGTILSCHSHEHNKRVTYLSFSPDCRNLAASYYADDHVALYTVVPPTKITPCTIKSSLSSIMRLEFVEDNTLCLANNTETEVWDTSQKLPKKKHAQKLPQKNHKTVKLNFTRTSATKRAHENLLHEVLENTIILILKDAQPASPTDQSHEPE